MLNQTRMDAICRTIANYLPARIVYWCSQRVWRHAERTISTRVSHELFMFQCIAKWYSDRLRIEDHDRISSDEAIRRGKRKYEEGEGVHSGQHDGHKE